MSEAHQQPSAARREFDLGDVVIAINRVEQQLELAAFTVWRGFVFGIGLALGAAAIAALGYALAIGAGVAVLQDLTGPR